MYDGMSDEAVNAAERAAERIRSEVIDHNSDAGHEQMIQQLAEKLGAAHLQLRGAEKRAEAYAMRIDRMRAQMLIVARDLAGAGGLDHKSKNEALLTAIHDLMGVGLLPGDVAELTEIPF